MAEKCGNPDCGKEFDYWERGLNALYCSTECAADVRRIQQRDLMRKRRGSKPGRGRGRPKTKIA